jgi:hypothetical protein
MADKMTYKQIVHKIIYDSGYAREIADLIARARRKDKAAIDEIERRFDPRNEELEDLGLSKKALENLSCAEDKQIFDTNHTSWMLLDFARMMY